VLARLKACDGLESYSQNTQTYLALIVDFRGIIHAEFHLVFS
jgi:hypothetical protein